MNLSTTLFAVPLLLVLCTALGCEGVNSSITGEVTIGDDTTCYLNVNNKKLNVVAEILAEKMKAIVVLAEGVDGATEVSTEIKADSWEQGLESLASDFDLRVEHDETTNTYTLVPL